MKKLIFLGLILLPFFGKAQTTGFMTDTRDGRNYKIVKIGNQWWMAQNLNFGTQIDLYTVASNNDKVEKYCYSNSAADCDSYGGLYTWDEIMEYSMAESIQGICPFGWHIPSDQEWKELEMSLGMSQEDADLLYSWRGSSIGTQLKDDGGSGFNGLLAGYKNSTPLYADKGSSGYFWSSSSYNSQDSYVRILKDGETGVGHWTYHKTDGMSVRCVKDAEGKITDARDGKVYSTVKIGEQWWMSENLNYGSRIDGNVSQTDNAAVEKYCYDNLETNCDTLGALYQWNEMMNYSADAMHKGVCHGICPAGWHIPTDEEWKKLEMYLGMSQAEADLTGFRGTDEGTQLKTGGSSGFNAALDGYMTTSNNFIRYGTGNCFWTSTDLYARYLLNSSSQVYRWDAPLKSYGLSVRCVIDDPFVADESGLQGVSGSPTKWCDYDKDGDMDLYIRGTVADVYRNNGSGVFTAIGANLVEASGSADWGDYNCDGYPDLLIAGWSTADGGYVTRLYRNNGAGGLVNYVIDVPGGSLARWGDYDSDGDPDILINQNDEKFEIYENKGSGTYHRTNIYFEKVKTDLPSLTNASCDWGDYNNDGFQDLVISGRDEINNKYCKIFRNNGDRTFTDLGLILRGASMGRINWGDFDNDDDLDILMTGYYNDIQLYRNEGNDIFSFFNSDLADGQLINTWFDFNNDGNLDVLLAGSSSYYRYVNLYSGNGEGTFKEKSCPVLNDFNGDVDIADYDNDNDLDFILSGRLYRNTTVVDNMAPGVPDGLTARQMGSDVVFSWNPAHDTENGERVSYNITAGTSPDDCIIISPLSRLTDGKRLKLNWGNVGYNTTWVLKDAPVGLLYWSVQSIDKTMKSSGFASFQSLEVKPPFSENTIGDALTDLNIRGSTFIDINNDGLLDILASGSFDAGLIPDPQLHCFLNQGNNTFISGTISGSKLNGKIMPCNLNGDAYMDALLYGEDYIPTGTDHEYNRELKVYALINNGTNGFTVSTGDFADIIARAVAFADFDNDGDEDILLFGYKNDTVGTYLFKKVTQGYSVQDLGFWLASQSYVVFAGDIDNDQDIDVAYNNSILENNSGFFTVRDIFPLKSVMSMDWGDFDNDGDLDAVFCGQDTVDNYVVQIYRNSGDLNFSEVKIKLQAFSSGGYVRWLDFNNDGLLDLATSGNAGGSKMFIYLNQGNDSFEENQFADYSCFDWGDSDNDGDLDILSDKTLYVSNGDWSNDAPPAPTGLTSRLEGFDVVLSWDKAFDEQSGSSLSYNIKVGSDRGKYDIMQVLTAAGGQLRIPRIGNVQTNTSWRLKDLPVGEYYWTVQAVDYAFKGGPWAEESSFTLGNVFVDFSFDTVCLGNATIFTNLSQSREGEITSYHWDFGDGATSNSTDPVHIFSGSGTFNVKLTVIVNAYSYYSTKKVIVKPKPVADFSWEPASEGGDIIRFDNKTDTAGIEVKTWEWDFGDGGSFSAKDPSPHAYLSTGKYTVKLSLTCVNSCSDAVSKEIQVCHGLLKKPDLRAFGPNLWYLICSNDTAKFYRWFYNNNLVYNKYTFIYFAYQNLGDYQVAISNDDECYVSSDVVSIPTIGEHAAENSDNIIIYPNPTNGSIRILYSDPYTGPVMVKIYNAMGLMVKEMKLYKNSFSYSEEMDLSDLGKGLFMLELKTNQKSLKTRILVGD
jgi:uncharacterized protein (TIGR02145 family)